MKVFIGKNLSWLAGLFIGFSLPIATPIFSRKLDLLFLIPAIICLIISYYYYFIYKED